LTTIAVIGSGRIGAALARKWAAAGHTVTFGARSPAKPALVELAEQIGAERAEIEAAVERSDVAVFAIPGAEMAETISRLGRLLDGKLVVDAANNVRAEHANSAIAVAEAAPAASYYRAFQLVRMGAAGATDRRRHAGRRLLLRTRRRSRRDH